MVAKKKRKKPRTAAQKRATAKMLKARKASVRKKKTPTKKKKKAAKKPISKPKKKGGPVAKKKKGGRKKRRSPAQRGFVGKEGMRDLFMMAALGVVGAVAGGAIVNQIPIKDNRIKAILPIGLGLLIGASRMAQRTPALQGASLGLVTVGGLGLAKQGFGEKVPLLAGDPIRLAHYNNYENAMLGYAPTNGNAEPMGDPIALAGNNVDELDEVLDAENYEESMEMMGV